MTPLFSCLVACVLTNFVVCGKTWEKKPQELLSLCVFEKLCCSYKVVGVSLSCKT